jgi:GH25 family lysozyme M1 (1,4-beta-N-acetylmuramidase)
LTSSPDQAQLTFSENANGEFPPLSRHNLWLFWQYSGTGKVAGINGKVDLNAFQGSRSEWATWLAQ